MKKFLLIAAVAATFTACNNDKATETTVADSSAMANDAMMTDTSSMSQMATTSTPAYTEGSRMMKGGKVMSYKSNAWVEMTEPATLNNGMRVMSNGDVIMNGKTTRMTEGQWMNAEGMMMDDAAISPTPTPTSTSGGSNVNATNNGQPQPDNVDLMNPKGGAGSNPGSPQ